ncbi:MAG: CvpA family protein [Bacteroidales bacterium]|nr:CvpA family protein [Bacteroidales bacterium]
MNWLDLILILLLAGGLISGFKNGIIGEVATLAALILGVWGAIRFSWWTAELLIQWGVTSSSMSIISFIVTFVIIVVVIQILAKFLNKLLDSMSLGFVNRLAGMAVGVIKSALIVSVILFVIESIDENGTFIKEDIKEGSLLYQPLSNLVPTILPFIHIENLGSLKKQPDQEEQEI